MRAPCLQSHRDETRLLWFDSSGRELSQLGASGAYFTIASSPDDRRLLFARLRPELGTYDIWSMDLSQTPVTESPVTTSPGMETGDPGFQIATSISPDGAQVFYQQRAPQGTWGREYLLRMSPTGRQVIYISTKSGRPQLYAAAWPADGTERALSTGAVSRGRWGRDGRSSFSRADR